MNVQVYNPEMGTKKYVGQIAGFVSNSGFVLAIVVDEQGNFRGEKLEAIKKETENGRSNESVAAPEYRGSDHSRADGFPGNKTGARKGNLRGS